MRIDLGHINVSDLNNFAIGLLTIAYPNTCNDAQLGNVEAQGTSA